MKICEQPKCKEWAVAKGLCMKHYQRLRRIKKDRDKPRTVEPVKPLEPQETVLLTPADRVARDGDTAERKRQALAILARYPDGLPPPSNVHLEPEDVTHWRQIIAARAIVSWYDAELVRAAQLARLRTKIEKLLLNMEDTIDDARYLSQLMRLEITLAKELHVHTTAVRGKPRESGEELKRQKAMDGAIGDDDGLDAEPLE